MCSINGCLVLEKKRNAEELMEIEERLKALFTSGEERGRDSYGIVTFYRDGSRHVFKRVGRPSDSIGEWKGALSDSTTIVINNDRAEPTTEYVQFKSEEDIQPFGSTIVITHNGTIANDRELEQEYGLSRDTRIDSAIIPPLLERLWDGSMNGLQTILRDKIIGSYALAIVQSNNPGELFLACNYKPLFIEYQKEYETIFFSSMESYLGGAVDIFTSGPIREVSPYTLLRLDATRGIEELSLWKDSDSERRALVVSSGGLDSTVVAKVMKDRGYQVTLLHFRYGQKAEAREAKSVQRIAEELDLTTIFLDTDLFKMIGHSPLLDPSGEIVTRDAGMSGAEFAHEWVPARNLVFFSIATAIAEAHGYGVIASGINLEEAGAYPDNEMIFNLKFSKLLPHSTQHQKQVRIEMPIGNLMKREIVQLGLKINAPLDQTWSCYEGGESHCGRCGPCFLRLKAFEMNRALDPAIHGTEIRNKN